jgi:phosphopantothenoylcysteine decarboxylase/phosphopantothenate--cysteine ligase
MSSFSGKKILIGVSGSIAAYKIANLVRLLIKSGNEVRVLMTPSATGFISPLTLSTLSKNPVYTNVLSVDGWNNHVEMGMWADVMLIAPATANTMAKMVAGMSDNMLIASYLSSKCPVFFAPAMDLDMWKHPSTLSNLQTLESYGNRMIPVGFGELASGLVGEGRMAEPEEIIKFLAHHFNSSEELKGKKVLITAGPTQEAIDPVRFIGNHSTGKMGICLAEECAMRSAEVILILGPSALKPDNPNIKVVPVKSADEMYQAALEDFPDSNITILSAAVADYKPIQSADEKIKKQAGDLAIHLSRTPDIAYELGKIKKENQLSIGFALETQNEVENAIKKLAKKNFDFIVLNSLKDPGAGFIHSTNKVQIIHSREKIQQFKLKSKNLVAKDIVDEVVELINQNALVI